MKIDGSIHKSGFPIDFVPALLKPIKNEHIMSPFELKMIALFKKNKGKKKKGKKKKTKKKGGGKSKYNIKMARKFRRTRRKRGSGSDPEPEKESDRLAEEARLLQVELTKLAESSGTLSEEYKTKNDEWNEKLKQKEKALELERSKKTDASGPSGGRRKRSRRKRRRRTKKRKSRRRKKRSRRRRSRRRKRGGEKGCKRWCGKQRLGDVCDRKSVGSDCQQGLVCAGWNGTLHTCIEGD
tara:strand:+ start:7403 stop:8119 length:717 start_codon:yes stop_codon:yes gene_type:complete